VAHRGARPVSAQRNACARGCSRQNDTAATADPADAELSRHQPVPMMGGPRTIAKTGVAQPPFGTFSPAADAAWVSGAPATLALALVVTATPVVLHLSGQFVGIAACTVLAVLVAGFAAPALPVVLVFSCLFQNLFVSLVSPAITSADQLNAIRAYNFILTVVAWAVVVAPYWLARGSFDRSLRLLIDVTTGLLILVGAYFVIGLAANPSGAIAYLRNIATPILLFQVFALVAYRHRLSLTAALVAMAIFEAVYGYLELFAHEALFDLVNGDVYVNWRISQSYEAGVWLKELNATGRVMRSYLDTLVVDFLNTPLLANLELQFVRILGPNFHFISYAYALAFFSVILFAIGRWWYALLALPLLLVIGSKGALIFAVLVILAAACLLRLRGLLPLALYGFLLLVYVAVGIVTGIQTQDYHVIGFIGGLRGFLVNPIGRGIGVGGNLSLDMSTIDWSQSQHLGHTDVAVESAIGVLLYQMGMSAFVLLAVVAWIALKLWKRYLASGSRLHATVSLALITLAANGIFQEEAIFAPLAFGVALGFAGLLLGRACRTNAASAPPEHGRTAVYHY
jgi:hypothetical protein